MKSSIPALHRAVPARLFAALVIALLAVFTTGTVAHAHDELVGSTPKSGSTLTESPDEITLNYSGTLQTLANDGGTVVVITDGDGQKVENSFEVKGRDVIVTPATALANGDYTVATRVISSDGHPIEKSIKFTVNAPQNTSPTPTETQAPATTSAAAQAPTAASSDPATAADPADDQSSEGTSPVVWIVVGVVIIAAAVAVLANVARRNANR